MTTRDRRIIQFCAETVWAIHEPTLRLIREIVSRHAAGVKLSGEEIEAAVGTRGRPPQQSNGGVAVVPLWGVLVPHGGMMVDTSTPGTGLDSWLEMFQAAVDDPNVSAVVIDVNSPGGSAQGVSETAAVVRAARGQKPVVAVANYLTASAAYAIAAQASTLVASPSAMVGSIGTYWIHEDASEQLAQQGVKATIVQAPADGYKTETSPFGPLTAEALAHQQEMVNAFYAQFVGDVAKGRGIDASTVEADYGRGRLFTASAAMNAGMVDGIASLDQVVQKLLAGQPSVRGAKAHTLERPKALGAAAYAGLLGSSAAQSSASFGQLRFVAAAPLEGPVPAKSTDVVDEQWDGPGEVAKLASPVTKTRGFGMFAWFDSAGADEDGDGYPDAKAAWKFPHHRVTDGEPGPAVISGVRDALARIDQADIPDSDRAGVRAHLDQHMQDWRDQTTSTDPASLAATHAAEAATNNNKKETTMNAVSNERPQTLEELAAQRDSLKNQIKDLNTSAAGRMLSADEQEQFDGLTEEIEKVDATMANIVHREKVIGGIDKEAAAANGDGSKGVSSLNHLKPVNLPQNPFDIESYRQHASSIDDLSRKLTDGARKVNADMAAYEAGDDAKVRARVDRLLLGAADKAAGAESFAHRILLTANPEFDAAFGRRILGKPMTHRDEQIIRSAVSVTGLSTETPIPITIDPTVLLDSDGVTNPMRRLARVVTITGNTWRGIASDGVAWTYDAELDAVNPETPTFRGPEKTVSRSQCEVQFSIEVDQDWGALRSELATLVADAKNIKEAEKFLNGTGTGEPEGLIFKLNDEGSSVVTTATGSTLVLTDVEALADSLPPRFDNASSWLAAKAFYSDIRSLAGAEGRIDVWVPLAQGFAAPGNGALPYTLLGYGASSASEVSKAFTTPGENVAVLGDYQRGFVIIDRVGMNVELDPLVRNGDGKLVGARALFFYARNTSMVLSVNAFRMLQIKA